jgi:hypothetical protein
MTKYRFEQSLVEPVQSLSPSARQNAMSDRTDIKLNRSRDALTFSCTPDAPFRLRGTGTSIRWRTIVMCSVKRQTVATPGSKTVQVSQSRSNETGNLIPLTFPAHDGSYLSSSTLLSRLLDTSKRDRVPPVFLPKVKVPIR